MKQSISKIIKKYFFKSRNRNSNIEKTNFFELYKNISENVSLKGDNVLDKVNPHLIYVGNHCVIGHRSSILTHCPIRGAVAAKLGDFVWLGFAVIVLPGSKIGNNTIVGGGSVVTKSFPDNVIIAGNPAKVIRELTEDEIKSLQYRLENRIPMGKASID